MSTAAIIGGSLAGAGISAGTSLAASGEQADAAKSAAQLQKEEADKSLAFQQKEWDTQQQNMAPWLKAGQGAITSLSDLLNGGGFPAFGEQFQAPTAEQAAQTPGYQFEKQQGEQALNNSAASRGGLLSEGTAKNLDAYGTGLAASNYSDVYNRAMQEYQNRYNIFQQNQANKFNRYATIAGLGQTAAGQLGAQGQAAAGNVANINLTAGGQIGQNINNAGAARASGYVGAGNAFGGTFNNIGQYASLYNLLNPNQYSAGQAPGGNTGDFSNPTGGGY